jgi:hypothetical protein
MGQTQAATTTTTTTTAAATATVAPAAAAKTTGTNANNIHPYLTEPDLIVLGNLFEDVKQDIRGRKGDPSKPSSPEILEEKAPETEPISHDHDAAAIARLKALNDVHSPAFQPTVFTAWDEKDLPPWLKHYLIDPYTRWAIGIVRHPTDVVFLTHILVYFLVNVPSAVYLFYNFTYVHGVLHSVYTLWCAGAFTLMMHNHIHNNGVLAKDKGSMTRWVDWAFPYVLEPLMGHTWDSYYYHHVKHHHVEGNGEFFCSSMLFGLFEKRGGLSGSNLLTVTCLPHSPPTRANYGD